MGGDETLDGLAARLAATATSGLDLRDGEIHAATIDAIETALIEKALQHTGGVKTKAADFLGINRNTLNKKVKDLGIQAAD